MIEYCAGLLFDNEMSTIVLLEKKHGPVNTIGKLIGVGGKLEPGESPYDAMVREYKEEAAATVSDWKKFCILNVRGLELRAKVHYFYATDTLAVSKSHALTDEPIRVLPLSRLKLVTNLMPNLTWMIPWLLDDSICKQDMGTLEYHIHV